MGSIDCNVRAAQLITDATIGAFALQLRETLSMSIKTYFAITAFPLTNVLRLNRNLLPLMATM